MNLRRITASDTVFSEASFTDGSKVVLYEDHRRCWKARWLNSDGSIRIGKDFSHQKNGAGQAESWYEALVETITGEKNTDESDSNYIKRQETTLPGLPGFILIRGDSIGAREGIKRENKTGGGS